MERIVIVGAGQAGVAAAVNLREQGFRGTLTLIGEETPLPYHRPPLSKSFDRMPDADAIALRPLQFYAAHGIDLLRGVTVETVDRDRRVVECRDGTRLAYDHLVLATGAFNRSLPLLDGFGNVASVRSLEDASALFRQADLRERIVVIGGGFIGAEIAAALRTAGKQVTILEAGERLLARSVAPQTSAHVLAGLLSAGLDVRFGARIVRLETGMEQIRAIQLEDGSTIHCDLVVVGIGAAPHTALAERIGLAIENGIVADKRMRTSDPDISALGDCAAVRDGEGKIQRHESVPSALHQARIVAAALLGTVPPSGFVPWFWSDIGNLKLKIVGDTRDSDSSFLQPHMAGDAYARLFFRNGRLVAAETVNASRTHAAARKLLEQGRSITFDSVRDAGFDLAALIAARRETALT